MAVLVWHQAGFSNKEGLDHNDKKCYSQKFNLTEVGMVSTATRTSELVFERLACLASNEICFCQKLYFVFYYVWPTTWNTYLFGSFPIYHIYQQSCSLWGPLSEKY